jgi:hypothetical protein
MTGPLEGKNCREQGNARSRQNLFPDVRRGNYQYRSTL